MTDSVATRLSALCDETLGELAPGPERAVVEEVRDRLAQPLRLAVAGPVSSGKSTLVNALLGQRVAPVGAGETTRVVTWYRYGVEDRAVLHLRGGRTEPVPLVDGRLPHDLGHRPRDVDRVVVDLSNDRLRHLQVIDTPGSNTTSDELERTSRRALGLDGDPEGQGEATRAAVGQVDSVVFLLPHLRARDVEVLEEVSRTFAGTAMSGLSTVGVLSRIDRMAGDEDPWPAARRTAERLHAQLVASVATVTPVIGLLAETVACGAFTESDAAALRELGRLDAGQREDLLVDSTEFLTSPLVALSEHVRRHLLERLGLYGLGLAGRAVAEHGAGDASALLRVLGAASGFDQLLATLDRQVLSRADLLTAHTAIDRLRRLSYSGATGHNARVLGALRDPLEGVELDGDLHRLRLLDRLTQAYRGELHLPEARRRELERLALGRSPADRLGLEPLDGMAGSGASADDVAEAALVVASTWVALSNDPRRSPAERSAARDVRTALELMVTETATPVVSPRTGAGR